MPRGSQAGKDDYKIMAFVPGFDDIIEMRLNLEHIHDPTLRPLDELLKDHFLQGLYKHVKGAGDPKNIDGDDDLFDDLRERNVNLSDTKWTTESGKAIFELVLQDSLHTHQMLQGLEAH